MAAVAVVAVTLQAAPQVHSLLAQFPMRLALLASRQRTVASTDLLAPQRQSAAQDKSLL
jgi:hypothetical protein